MADVQTILGYIFILQFWMGILSLSIYFIYQVIDYLQHKPPNLQTLLDGIYVQMFYSWILEVVCLVVFIVIIILDIKVWIVTVIVGNVVYGSVLLTAFYMLESCIYRLIIITKPGLIENMLDEDILNYSK